MAFTATLDAVSRAGDPGMFDLAVSYADSSDPEWHVAKILRVTVDPSQTVAQQQQAIRQAVTADAQRYKQQLTIYAQLQSLVGQTITI